MVSEVKSEVFVRKSSGLVREVGLLGGALFNFSNTAPFLAAGQMLPYFIIWANGGNLILGLLIGTAAGMLMNSVYAHFTSAMPRSGGEYVFLGRTVSPTLGFLVNWVNMATYTFWWMADVIFQTGLIYVFLAFFMPEATIGWLNLRQGILIVATILMIIQTLLVVLGMKVYLRLQNVLYVFAFAISAVVIVGWISAFGNFSQLFNEWALRYLPNQPGAYQKIIENAVANGFSLNPPESWGLEQTLIMAAIFVTVQSPYTAFTSYIAGEIKKAESGLRQHFFVETAALFQGLIFMLFGWAWIKMSGLEFLAALAHSGSLGLPINILFWTDVAPVMGDAIAALFVLSIFLTWQLPSMAKLTAISRCAFAWSFDRVIPTSFAHVSDRHKTPTYTIWGAFVVTFICLLLWAFGGDVIWTYIAACVFWGLLNLMLVAIAGAIFPYIKKEMFEVMPLKGRIAGIPILTIISVLGLALCLWTTTAYFTNPAWTASYGVTPTTIGTSVFIYALGLIIPQISRAYWRRKGIDLDIAFKQIPPA